MFDYIEKHTKLRMSVPLKAWFKHSYNSNGMRLRRVNEGTNNCV